MAGIRPIYWVLYLAMMETPAFTSSPHFTTSLRSFSSGMATSTWEPKTMAPIRCPAARLSPSLMYETMLLTSREAIWMTPIFTPAIAGTGSTPRCHTASATRSNIWRLWTS